LRRQVTVLHCECDLFDSDAFLDNLSAEEQHTTLREYQRLCRASAEQWGGTLVQSTGQSLLVCFGYPTAYEDAARRAVRSGLKLLADFADVRARLREAHGLSFGVRIGVHTGSAVLQDADSAEGESFSMMGEARTVATRLQGVCPDDTLVVSENTQRIVHGYFAFESQGKSRLKGAPDPLETFIVRGESEARTRIEVGERDSMTPLVGRTEEMSLLVDLWDEATEAMGQIVCIIGEAGLGKSRLVREIREYVKHERGDERTMIFEWRCSPFFQNTALHPATEYLEAALKFASEPSLAKRLDLLVTHLEAYDSADAETVSLMADLLSLPADDRFPPLSLSPQRQKEKTLDALLNLLRRYAAKQSVLFVVEDLHWVDATTLELLGSLVDQGAGDRILTILTFRPEFETPWGSRAYQTQIALNRLTRSEVESMICGRVGLADVADEVVERIIERTEGVPLFVEEFCNALVEAKAFVTINGRMQLSDAFDIAAIPATLKDLLISRLDRLDIRSDLVLLGATIGREFSYQMMRAITGLPDDVLRSELDRLVSAEIVYREGVPPQALYTFKHALIQDAAYDSLLTENRRENHLNIANVLDSDFPETKDSTPEVLAHHFTQGGRKEQGMHYWLQAGQQAQAKSANNEAISHLQTGLSIAQSIEDEQQREQLEMAFRFPLIAVLMGARGYAAPEIEPHHKRVQEIGMKSGDPNLVGRLLLPYWQYVFINGNYKKSLETTDSLLENAAKAGDAGLATEAHWSSGCTKFFLGRFQETVDHERQALATYDLKTSIEFAKVSYQNSGPLAYAFMSKALWALGKVDASLEAMDEALRTAHQLPEPFSLVVVNWNSADLGELMRDADRTDLFAKKTIQSCEELGFPFFLGMGTCSSGNAMFMRGQYEAAAETIQRGINTMMATGADIVFPLYFTFLAETYWKLGRRDDANEALGQAFARLEPGERFYEAEMLRIRGEFAMDSGDPPAARRFFDQSLAVAERQRAGSFTLRTTLRIAKELVNEGHRLQALELVRSAVARIEGGTNTPDVIAYASLYQELRTMDS
jgi:class 3 adenylate cyclase/tetratricopeptide (TPR) repeat protein